MYIKVPWTAVELPLPGSATYGTPSDDDTRRKADHNMAVLMQHVPQQRTLCRAASLHAQKDEAPIYASLTLWRISLRM